MSVSIQRPEFPAGAYVPCDMLDPGVRAAGLHELEHAPAALSRVVHGITDAQLDTRYRNWTARQIVHHLADSHAHALLRLKLALTEDCPTIKPYDEAATVLLPDSATQPIEPALMMLDGIHSRLCHLVRGLDESQLRREYFHPEQNRRVTIAEALSYYPWHARHHIAQVAHLRQTRT